MAVASSWQLSLVVLLGMLPFQIPPPLPRIAHDEDLEILPHQLLQIESTGCFSESLLASLTNLAFALSAYLDCPISRHMFDARFLSVSCGAHAKQTSCELAKLQLLEFVRVAHWSFGVIAYSKIRSLLTFRGLTVRCHSYLYSCSNYYLTRQM